MPATRPVPPDDQWRIPDALGARLEPLLPVHTPRPHPLGCHRPRVPDRAALDGVLFVLRTGCQWNALNRTGICSSSVAHRRFQAWVAAGVFSRLWAAALAEYDAVKGIDWAWLSMDGRMTEAPLGGGENRPQPDRPGQGRSEAEPAGGRRRGAARVGRRRGQPAR